MNRYIEDNVANAYAEYQKNDGILTFAEWHHLAPPHPTCNICVEIQLTQTFTRDKQEDMPFLRLITYGVHRGVVHCRIAIQLCDVWRYWDLQHELVEDWYLLNLQCKLAFGDNVVIEGSDKLLEWRQSLTETQYEYTNTTCA